MIESFIINFLGIMLITIAVVSSLCFLIDCILLLIFISYLLIFILIAAGLAFFMTIFGE